MENEAQCLMQDICPDLQSVHLRSKYKFEWDPAETFDMS